MNTESVHADPVRCWYCANDYPEDCNGYANETGPAVRCGARNAETVSDDWRASMAVPCTCSPDDGSGRCEREQECYEAWSAFQFQALRIDGGGSDGEDNWYEP